MNLGYLVGIVVGHSLNKVSGGNFLDALQVTRCWILRRYLQPLEYRFILPFFHQY